MTVRLLLVDDSDEFIATARRLLEREGLEVVGTANTGDEAVDKAKQLVPVVALVDINLGGESGFDVVRRILEGQADHARAILISSYSPDDFADLIAESPAVGFVSKSRLSAASILEILGFDPEASRPA
jgi:two-component system, NarL family, nitrate/nitrite response regulator NarL